MSSVSKKYCCCINCSQHSQCFDIRTGQHVRMHRFPDPVKERERCLKWIVNLRRADLNLGNIKHKVVCSTHFRCEDYNYPDDISKSRLLPTAVPSIVNCPNPPKAANSSRKPPKSRVQATPTIQFAPATPSLCSPSAGSQFMPDESRKRDLGDCQIQTPTPKKPRKDFSMTLEEALIEIGKLRAENKNLKKKYRRVKQKCVDLEFKFHNALEKKDKEFTDKFLEKLPKVPQSLLKILLRQTRTINNWWKEKHTMDLCLSVYFRSAAAYKVLRASGFVLPHPRTLQRKFKTVLQKPGLCPKLQEMLKLRAATLSEHERQVTLSLDGMTIKPGLTYKPEEDKILGVIDFGQNIVSHTSNVISNEVVANQGVLFMVRGLSLSWKQIIGFYITKHSISTKILTELIKDAITFVKECGLHVRLIVMDQEASQWKWVKEMAVSPDKPFFEASGEKVFVAADAPHLIKNLRNNLFTKNIVYIHEGIQRIAKFEHIKSLYELDSKSAIRLVPKWSDNHFHLPRGKNMKVILACQIFSHTASAAMQFCIKKGDLTKEAMDTAIFLNLTNEMWDFVDSQSMSAPLPKRAINQRNFEHQMHKFDCFISFVSSWKFVTKSKFVSIPSHSGWLLTLQALKQMCFTLILDEKLMNFLCLRKCNQDHVENMHSRIRAYNGFNDHPHLTQYINAIRCLASSFSTSELIDSSISAGKNCIDDEDEEEVSNSFQHDFVSNSACSFPTGINKPELPTFDSDNLQESSSVVGFSSCESLNNKDINVIEYICGSVLRSLSKSFDRYNICNVCFSKCLGGNTCINFSFTALKEYNEGSLVRASSGIQAVAQKLETCFRSVTALPYDKPRLNITQLFMANSIEEVNAVDSPCGHMPVLLTHFIKGYINLRIFQYVKLFNQSLNSRKRGLELNKDKKLNF